jgi:hypothetical protein
MVKKVAKGMKRQRKGEGNWENCTKKTAPTFSGRGRMIIMIIKKR